MKRIISIPPNYFYACILLCIPFYFWPHLLRCILFPYNLVGILLMSVGIYLVIDAWYILKKHETPEDFSESKTLVTDSIYKYSRNPMYLGGVIALIGLAITTGSLMALCSPVLFFIVMHYMFIPYEELKMKKTFDRDYENYQKTVRRWI